jgi:hypothetical protein
MGRPTKTSGSSFWYSNFARLTPEQERKLTEDHLGIDADTDTEIERAKQAIKAIRYLLGSHDGG